MDITERLHAACTGYLTVRGLPTHDGLLMDAAGEIDLLRTRLAAMRQCFIDYTLHTTPSAKGTNIGKQIDEAVDRVVNRKPWVPNGQVQASGAGLCAASPGTDS